MAVDTYITSLNLHQAFKGEDPFSENRTEDDAYSILFEKSNRSNLIVFDDADVGHSRFITETKGIGSDKVLSVSNPQHLDSFLLHIDGVLFSKQSKCDCALISDQKIAFIEFKTNAANKTKESREDCYNKCYNQLKTTVNVFDNRYEKIHESFRSKFNSLCAIGVFNPTTPATPASLKNLSVKFLREVKMKLSFTNKTKLD